MFTFFTLVQTLSDFMEVNDLPDRIDFKFQIRHHASELRKLLPAMIDRMIKKTDADMISVEQYVVASQVMEHLFNVGLQMENMEPSIKKQTLVNQLNILLHSYGLPQLELIEASERSAKVNSDEQT